jgi:hypothetical protein
MKKFTSFVTAIFVVLFVLAPINQASAEDFSLSLKENLLNKVISSKKVWEYNDKENGIYLKLSDLRFEVSSAGILGSAKIQEFKQANAPASIINSLIKQASDAHEIGNLKFLTQVGLNEDHQKIVLKNTKFTAFNNRYLPRFLENGVILKELNKKFAKEIDGKVVYEFPKSFAVDVSKISTLQDEVILSGDLAAPCERSDTNKH